MTATDLLLLPDDGMRHELIEGALLTTSPGGGEHGTVGANLIGSLQPYVRANRLGKVFNGETGFQLAAAPDTVRAPDAAFANHERLKVIERGPGYPGGVPDLVAEVVSPHDRFTRVERQVAMWLAHGAHMVLVVNPDQQTVAVHRSATEVRHLTIDDVLDGEEVVPGWRVPVRDLFAADEE